MTRPRCIPILFLAAVCGCGGGVTTAPPGSPPVVVQPPEPAITTQVMAIAQDTVAPQLQAETECSADAPRRGIVRVQWRAPQTDPAAALARHRIDLTVFHDGFERGLYISAPLQEKAQFQPARGVSLLANAPRGLREPLIDRAPIPAPRGFVAIELTRLEPGLLYRIRVPLQTDPARG
jgi:hypothetical protein